MGIGQHSFAKRVLRRFGRLGVACVAGAAGIAVLLLCLPILLMLVNVPGIRLTAVFVSLALAASATLAVFAKLERMGLAPDDSERPTSLSLKDYK